MNILYLTTEDLSAANVSGKVHFHAITRELVAQDHRVTVVAPAYSQQPIRVAEGASTYTIPGVRKTGLGLFLFECRLAVSLRKLKRLTSPDVLLVRGGGPGWIPGLLFLACRAMKLPVVLECNGIVWEEFKRRKFSRLAQALVRFSAWQQAKCCNAIIGVSSEITKTYARLGGKNAAACHTIMNGVDTSDFDFSQEFRTECRQKLGLSPETLVAGYVGTFSAWHNIPTILAAAKTLQETSTSTLFLMVGDGQGYAAAREYCEAHRLNNVRLEGQTEDRQTLRNLVACFDVGLCTNNEMHGSPLKLFEYLAAGIPVIGSGFPQVIELLNESNAGLAVPVADEAALAAAILEISSHRTTWNEVGRSNRDFAIRQHDWKHVAQRVQAVLESVIKPRDIRRR